MSTTLIEHAATPRASAAGPSSSPTDRLRGIDVMRGLVCVLMAIDHVRGYSGVPGGGPVPAIFLTRWITHFVAPGFCFFAGTAAYLYGVRVESTSRLRSFLVSRGLLLMALEFTLIRFLWSFNPDLTEFRMAGVIWMLGACMVLLGLMVNLPPKVIGWSGVAIVLVQRLFAFPPRLDGLTAIAPAWEFLYPAGARAPLDIVVLFVIVPWIGVMMAGYGFGLVMQREPMARNRFVVRLGLALTVGFLVIAAVKGLVTGTGDGEGGQGIRPGAPLWRLILDQQKYPASQLFLLMTLGPAIALLPSAERWKGWLGRMLETFGRVPMWYYLMHLLVIHLAAIVVNLVRTGTLSNAWFTTAPYTRVPPEGRWTLGAVWLVWLLCIAALYPICRWYAERKRTRPSPWMKYI